MVIFCDDVPQLGWLRLDKERGVELHFFEADGWFEIYALSEGRAANIAEDGVDGSTS